jgi:hypothetical protein
MVSPPRDRPIACEPFFFSRAGAVLMSANDCSVDHHVFVVGIARQQLENTVENAALCPSAKALVHDPPVAETRRQITPGNSRSISVKNPRQRTTGYPLQCRRHGLLCRAENS